MLFLFMVLQFSHTRYCCPTYSPHGLICSFVHIAKVFDLFTIMLNTTFTIPHTFWYHCMMSFLSLQPCHPSNVFLSINTIQNGHQNHSTSHHCAWLRLSCTSLSFSISIWLSNSWSMQISSNACEESLTKCYVFPSQNVVSLAYLFPVVSSVGSSQAFNNIFHISFIWVESSWKLLVGLSWSVSPIR